MQILHVEVLKSPAVVAITAPEWAKGTLWNITVGLASPFPSFSFASGRPIQKEAFSGLSTGCRLPDIPGADRELYSPLTFISYLSSSDASCMDRVGGSGGGVVPLPDAGSGRIRRHQSSRRLGCCREGRVDGQLG